MLRTNITQDELDALVGKSFILNYFSDETPAVNKKYHGAIGTFTSVGPIFNTRNGRCAMINVKWKNESLNGTILSIDAARDDFDVLEDQFGGDNDEYFESKHENRYYYRSLTEAKGLTPEEKMDKWHNGERKENIKACSDEKLKEYRKICRAKGYAEQVKLINAEIKRRKNESANTLTEGLFGTTEKERTQMETVKAMIKRLRSYMGDTGSSIADDNPVSAGLCYVKKGLKRDIPAITVHLKRFSKSYQGTEFSEVRKFAKMWDLQQEKIANEKDETIIVYTLSKDRKYPTTFNESLNESITYSNLTEIGQRAMDHAVEHLRAAFEDFTTIMFRGGMENDNDFEEMQELKNNLGKILDKLPW